MKTLFLILSISFMLQAFAQADEQLDPARRPKLGEEVYAMMYSYPDGDPLGFVLMTVETISIDEPDEFFYLNKNRITVNRGNIALQGTLGELSTGDHVVFADDGRRQIWTVLGFAKDGSVAIKHESLGGFLRDKWGVFEAQRLKKVNL